MFHSEKTGHGILFRISSQWHLVDRVIREVQCFWGNHRISESLEINLIIRELLNNAIEHGNRDLPGRTILCRIEHHVRDVLKVTVEDEGKGFDYRSLDMKLPADPGRIRNRGFALINSFAEKIEFNDRGNSITVFVAIPAQTIFSMDDDNGVAVITPSGDITASAADSFRALLVHLQNRGYSRFRFDLREVADVDSIILSVFINFAKITKKMGERAKPEIVNANTRLESLFFLTRLDRMFDIAGRK